MSIRLTKVFVKNFKSIKSLDLTLSFSNVFFGKNGAGKSAILKAINTAVNELNITKNDVFAGENEEFDPKKQVIIDLCFEPEGLEENTIDSEWKKILTGCIGKLDKTNREIFAFRTVFSYDEKADKFNAQKYVINVYKNNGESLIGEPLRDGILSFHIHSYYLNASRSAQENLKDREDYWQNMIEFTQLARDYDYSLLPKEIREDLANFNIDYAEKTILQDMDDSSGTSSVIVFETMKKQIETVYKIVKPFHSIYLVEEPESHMHPQAQMQVMKIINNTPGQKYVATHSSYIVNHFPIHKLCRVVNEGEGTRIYKFGNRLSMKELRNINLRCMLYKAEMVFANKVVLFEGQTEHIALPIYFNKFFGNHPFESGYSFVYVEGSNNYKSYLEICNAFHIDWHVYSDGEQVVIDFLNNMMRDVSGNKGDVENDPHYVIIKDNLCYEDDLIYHGFANDVSEAIDILEKTPNYIRNRLMNGYAWKQFKSESKKYIQEVDDYLQALSYYSKRHKIDLAEIVSKTICKNHDKNDLPRSVLELFNKIK